jgi:hypothetical protein
MRGKVAELMPALRGDLEDLVRIPSVSAPGVIDEPLLEAFDLTTKLFAAAGWRSAASTCRTQRRS